MICTGYYGSTENLCLVSLGLVSLCPWPGGEARRAVCEGHVLVLSRVLSICQTPSPYLLNLMEVLESI